MKKRIILISVSLFLPMLCSCIFNINRKNDLLFECFLNTFNNGTHFFLEVKFIKKEEYLLNKGINVVKDVVAKEDKYYLINFYSVDGNDNKLTYDFYNLIDAYPKTKAVPVAYKDDNDNRICPRSSMKVSTSSFYSITYNQINYIFKQN